MPQEVQGACHAVERRFSSRKKETSVLDHRMEKTPAVIEEKLALLRRATQQKDAISRAVAVR
jgi:hypothetical protein